MTDEQVLADLTAKIQELNDVISMSNGPGWKRVVDKLDGFVEEAHEAMLGAGDKPDIVLAPLARRYIQRLVQNRGLQDYIASCKTEQVELLKSIEDDRSVPRAEQD